MAFKNTCRQRIFHTLSMEALRASFTSKGQAHVFKFYESLSAERKEAFEHQLSKIDLEEVTLVHKGFANAASGMRIAGCLT